MAEQPERRKTARPAETKKGGPEPKDKGKLKVKNKEQCQKKKKNMARSEAVHCPQKVRVRASTGQYAELGALRLGGGHVAELGGLGEPGDDEGTPSRLGG